MISLKLDVSKENEVEVVKFIRLMQLCETKKDLTKVKVTSNVDSDRKALYYEVDIIV